MKIKTLTLDQTDFPKLLATIPTPPKQLYVLGADLQELMRRPRLAVVGSRKVSAYGRQITAQLAGDAARQGIVIISGLALGLDGLAHQAALDAGGLTIAILPAGLDKICPATHRQLAMSILRTGGALVSEYPEGTTPYLGNFLARNRIVSGLSDGVLIPEAAQRSGSLSTANHALEQGREVMAVPGNITSELSTGTNNLIKAGAAPITCIEDILQVLGLEATAIKDKDIVAANAEEHAILTLLQSGITDANELQTTSQLTPATFSQTLTMLEITSKIKPLGAGHWCLK